MIKNKSQIDNIRVAGNIIAQIFVILYEYLKEGMTTEQIDKFVYEQIVKEGGFPAFLGYQGYSASTCISIDEEIIHGLPSPKRIIIEGEIISIDIGVSYQGGIADGAYTFYLGDSPSPEIANLISSTKLALQAGIEIIKPNTHVADISKAIQEIANHNNLGIIKDYCGHGVGIKLHEKPEIPNYYPNSSDNPRLKAGMVVAIEPMFTLGTDEINYRDDKFTVITKDKSMAAHFEHTVLITEEGYKILT